MKVAAIDLFCGAGGLTHGFIQGGISVVAGIDIDAACEFPYEHNNKARFLKKNVSDVTGASLRRLLKGAERTVLAGCAPCQPFSTYTQGQETDKDGKWALLTEFLRIAKELKPDVVTMENVPQLKHHSIYNRFVAGLEAEDYTVEVTEVDCQLYGVPQTRRRLVLLASKHGELKLSKRGKSRKAHTVRSAIEGLPRLRAGSEHKDDPLHKTSSLSPTNLRRIKASSPGGSWRDWEIGLVAKCHTRKKGKSYPAVYGRMEWDQPAPTITTQCFGFGNGRFGHPTQARAISLREAAILQTFPTTYAFVPPGEAVHMKAVGRLIGNAVPVRLGEIIARSIVQHLGEVDT